jgi:hypothetical protein
MFDTALDRAAAGKHILNRRALIGERQKLELGIRLGGLHFTL